MLDDFHGQHYIKALIGGRKIFRGRRTVIERNTRLACMSLRCGNIVFRRIGANHRCAQPRERFRQGLSGNADVITASMSLNSARDLVIDALTSYHQARVALATAQGMTTMIQ